MKQLESMKISEIGKMRNYIKSDLTETDNAQIEITIFNKICLRK